MSGLAAAAGIDRPRVRVLSCGLRPATVPLHVNLPGALAGRRDIEAGLHPHQRVHLFNAERLFNPQCHVAGYGRFSVDRARQGRRLAPSILAPLVLDRPADPVGNKAAAMAQQPCLRAFLDEMARPASEVGLGQGIVGFKSEVLPDIRVLMGTKIGVGPRVTMRVR